jgi:predicted nucleic acid-binding protein
MTELVAIEGLLAVTEPVVMEVLAGARSGRREAELRRLLGRFTLLGVETVADFEGAARIYRRCRATGVTPRGLVDCLIAAVAHRRDAALLTSDIDLERVARVVGIQLDDASSGGG